MRHIIRLLWLFLAVPAFAGNGIIFVREDSTSVMLDSICLYDFADSKLIATDIDFNTALLNIRITASDNSESFNYPAVDIINVTTPATWQNPPAGDIGLDKQTDGCIVLHLRDEILDATVNSWMVVITDGATDELIDENVRIFVQLADSTDFQADVVSGLTTFGAATETNVDDNETKIDTMDTVVDSNASALVSLPGDVWAVDATGQQTQGTFGQLHGDPVASTETLFKAVVTDAAGVNVATDIIVIEGQTDDIGVAGAGLTAIPWNAAWDTQVQNAVATLVVDGTITLKCAMSLIAAYATGPWSTSGGGNLTVTYRNTDDTTDRLVLTGTSDGSSLSIGSFTCP